MKEEEEEGTDSWISSRLFFVLGVWLWLGLLRFVLGLRLMLGIGLVNGYCC